MARAHQEHHCQGAGKEKEIKILEAALAYFAHIAANTHDEKESKGEQHLEDLRE